MFNGVPPKAFVLWAIVVLGSGVVGFTAGSWIVPLALAIGRDGLSGLSELRTEWGVFPRAPAWIDPVRNRGMHVAVQFSGIALAMVGLRCGVVGERIYRYLVTKKLGWMTEEEVDAARKREKQLF
jgi:hypothetical protein